MKSSVNKMTHLTSHLLAYARGGKYQPQIIPLNDFVEDTLHIIQHKISSSIIVKTDLPEEISNIKADLTQIQIVLLGVLANASEAIEGKGCIEIITRNEKISEAHLDQKIGNYLSLTVKDNGKGMDKKTVNRIFEPFFTTNFQGRGLGMAAAYGIIKNHDGWIKIDSEPKKGTTVRIYLPAVAIQVQEKDEPKTEIQKSTDSILLVEDEEMVMDVCQEMLKKIGYNVLTAKSGKEAIEFANTHEGDISLTILDIGLPDMEGCDVYPLLMEARPDMKVIVCSGYSADGPVQELLDAGAQCCIPKPYSFSKLSAKIKELSDG